jgi:mannosyltransferase OCH1-like enzyme
LIYWYIVIIMRRRPVLALLVIVAAFVAIAILTKKPAMAKSAKRKSDERTERKNGENDERTERTKSEDATKNGTKRLVPARLVQTWKTLDLGALAPIARTWREWNPGFAYTLFDDAACAALIDRFGARVASAYARIGPGAFRADLWRYCELYTNGGVYVDVDTVCLGAVYDALDPTASLAVPVDLDPTNLFNAFVAAAPEHPVMRMCIDAVVENVEANKPQFGLGFSGPKLLGACVAAYLGAPYPTTFEARTVAGVQFLRFDAATEVVSNARGAALMQNKNGSRAIHEAYEAEATRASVVRYEMHGP